jgi:hypothetical protein
MQRNVSKKEKTQCENTGNSGPYGGDVFDTTAEYITNTYISLSVNSIDEAIK